jgi:hypothetical protein
MNTVRLLTAFGADGADGSGILLADRILGRRSSVGARIESAFGRSSALAAMRLRFDIHYEEQPA